jgi:hypothetical protein
VKILWRCAHHNGIFVAHERTGSSVTNLAILAQADRPLYFISGRSERISTRLGSKRLHYVLDAEIAKSVHRRVGRSRDRSSTPGRVKNVPVSLSRPALGPTQPHIQWVPGALFRGVKRLERKTVHLLPTSAQVKKKLIYTSTSPLCVHGVELY